MSGRPEAAGLAGIRPGSSRSEALRNLRSAFREAGLDTPALDARLLVTAALGLTPTELLTGADAPLGPGPARVLAGLAARRLAREPVARILGCREFWGLAFALSPDTLVPRPETETVVETALRLRGDRGRALQVLDLGTGSGCLLVALLTELARARGLGIDRSTRALATARANAVRHGVADRALFAVADWGAPVAARFDLVVANPPYIASDALAGLAPEVRSYDPPLALDGGPDGLAAYRAILPQIGRLLGPGGVAVLEIGFDQEPALRALAAVSGLPVREVARDLAGQPRAVALGRRDPAGSS